MAKIAYVTTAQSRLNNVGEIRVYYTNGRGRTYKPETVPNIVLEFCIKAIHCDEDKTTCENLKTYW